jgi:FMN-dependent NADH-azoreductase
MKKLLILSYLPKGDYSHTKPLRDYFEAEVKKSQITTVDLVDAYLPDFDYTSMMAYIKRNYMDQIPTKVEAESLVPMDKAVEQVLEHDVIAIFTPMHNFGAPAKVKSWLDHIVVQGKTFGKDIGFPEKKCLTIYTSGGSYDPDIVDGSYPRWDTLTQLMKINFSFMGFGSVEVQGYATSNKPLEGNALEHALSNIRDLVDRWEL